MTWLKDILAIIKTMPVRMQFALVAFIIFSISGIYYYRELHSYKLELAKIERQSPDYSPQKNINHRTKVKRIIKEENKQTAQSGKEKQ